MNDLISREAAINAIRRKYNEDDSDYPTMYQMGLHDANVIIEELPAVQPQQVTGKLDLISRQAAIDAVCEYCEYYYNENVIQSIKDLPSAQPEVIRCKDCVYYCNVLRSGTQFEEGDCDAVDEHYISGKKPDDYCSWAKERR